MHSAAARSGRGRKIRRETLALTIALAIVAATAQSGAQRLPVDLSYDFDIRLQWEAPGAPEYLAALIADAAVTAANLSQLDARVAGLAQLLADDAREVSLSPEIGALEIVRSRRGFLSEPSADRVAALRGFVTRHAFAFGLTAAEIETLDVVADYENPSGNMAWVELEQKINGIPVFRGYIRGGFTARGELARTTGQLAPVADAALLPTVPALGPADAVALVAAHAGWSVSASSLAPQPTDAAGRLRFSSPGFATDAHVWQVYFPFASGIARLAWATEIMAANAYLMVVDAANGTVLFRKNLTSYQAQPATYHIYDDDSPAPASPTEGLPGRNFLAPYISRSAITLRGNEPPYTFNDLGWIADGDNETAGNNVIAGPDRDLTSGPDHTVEGSPPRVFAFDYDPATEDPLDPDYENGAVTNVFYWTNRFHDEMYLLGFTEQARNFQQDNFGRGGSGNDRVSAHFLDVGGASFSTLSDGVRGRMFLGIWTNDSSRRSAGLERDIILHELTHGLSNRLHANASGLTGSMSSGLGEGWGDFYARALFATADEDVNGIYPLSAWITHNPQTDYSYYYGFRRFPYALWTTVGGPQGRPHNPLTFEDIDPTKISLNDAAYPQAAFPNTADEVHHVGEVWAMALFEVRARFINRLGFAVGNRRILQFVTDGMKLDPASPTFPQARDAIIDAAIAGGGTAADLTDIWAGFAVRGIGLFASVENAGVGGSRIRVTEDFTSFDASDPLPTLSIDDVTVTEGDAGTTTATFTVTLSSPMPNTPTVCFATGDAGTHSGVVTSTDEVVIPEQGAVTPYPAKVEVTDEEDRIVDLKVRLNGLSRRWVFDLDVLLVGPGGQSVMLMSDAGDGSRVDDATITFADGAPPLTDDTEIVDGATYAPTNLGPGDDNLPAPAPAAPFGSALSVFKGTDPGGTWSLFIQGGSDFPTLGTLDSFTLIITTAKADYEATWGALTFPPGTTTRTIDVIVHADVSTEADETFVVNLFEATGALLGNAQGVGTIVNDDEPPLAVDDAFAASFNSALTVPAPGILANDEENGGGPLTAIVSSLPANGTLAFDADGGFGYTPNAGFVGNDTFTYRATNGGGTGNVATVTIDVGAPATPQAPGGLQVSSIAGNLVTLRWTPSPIGPPATTFVVEGGRTPGSVQASLSTGSSAPIVTFAAPTGSFFVRVLQISGSDRSPASNEIAVHVNVPVPPSAPEGLLAAVNGSSLSLAWRNTFSGGPPTSLALDVTGSMAGSVPIAVTDHASVPVVPGGTYTLSLRARNDGGTSASSNAVSVAIPGPCTGEPLPPENVLVYKAGSVVTALWDPPPSGAAPSGYVVNVTGTFNLSIPTTQRGISRTAPAGTYTMTVAATNACGTSAPAAPQSVTVP